MGVLKPNRETVPTGVWISCEVVLLGVGVTVTTTCLVLWPPNVAVKLAANLSTSSGATYTCVVSYCEPTPTRGAASRALATELAARVAMATAAMSERRRTICGLLNGGDKQAVRRWARSCAFAHHRVDRDDDEAGYEPEVLE